MEEQEDVKEYTEEIYLTYVFPRQSSKQHNKLKTDVRYDFTTRDDRMPKKQSDGPPSLGQVHQESSGEPTHIIRSGIF